MKFSTKVQAVSNTLQKKLKGRYRYKPLEHPQSIRLLYILPGTFRDPIRCHLRELSLLESGPYDALSYCWGPPIFNNSIWIQNATHSFSRGSYSELKITQSLYEALLHIRREDDEVALWADAVCINQNDIEERGAQVQLMSQIYQDASQVRAWLGLEDDNSRLAFDWVNRTHAYALDVWSEATGLPRDTCDFSSYDWSQYLMDLYDRNCEVWLFDTFSHDSKARRYWQRRWVIQELAFARKATIMCGGLGLKWDILCDLFYLTMNRAGLDYNETILARALSGVLPSESGYMSRRKWKRYPLLHTFISAYDTLVTDPRDNLYAIYSLLTWSSPRNVIIPDYKKSVLEVYIDGTMAVLVESGLQSLCRARLLDSNDPVFIQEEHVPSWGFDFGNILFRDTGIKNPHEHFRAASSTEGYLIAAMCCTETVLEVKGLYCDAISLMGHHVDYIDANYIRQCDKQSEVGRYVGTEDLVSDIWPNVPDSLLRTIFWDCVNSPLRRLLQGLGRLSSSEFARRKEQFYSDAGILSSVDLAEGANETSDIDLSPVKNEQQRYRKALVDQALREHPGWRLCRYQSGRLGWVPEAAQPGDFIYILFGCPLPMILRPRSTEASSGIAINDVHATIVGYAYVEGVMDGELVTEESQEAALNICLH